MRQTADHIRHNPSLTFPSPYAHHAFLTNIPGSKTIPHNPNLRLKINTTKTKPTTLLMRLLNCISYIWLVILNHSFIISIFTTRTKKYPNHMAVIRLFRKFAE